MNDLFIAIVNWFNSDAALVAAIPGGIWLQQAPAKDPADNRPISRPYCVFFSLGNDFEFESGDAYLDYHAVQFSIFGDTQATTEAGRSALRSRFDAVKLSMEGAGVFCLMCLPANQTLTKEPDELWHATVDYEIMIQRSL